ncbi:MAG: PIN domain-containing protein [Acidobacteriota bacterium]
MNDYLLDTNLLLRFCDSASPQHPIAVNAIEILLKRGDQVFITAQNLIEFWAVATRPKLANGFDWTSQQTEQEIERLLNLFLFLEDSPAIFPHWRKLILQYSVSGKQVHDARLVAVMLTHGISQLITFNTSDFIRYSNITLIEPDAVK